MSIHRHAVSLAIALLLFAQSAQAFFDPPFVTPAEPIAGHTVSVNVRLGICDDIIEMAGFPQITQSGNAIRIVFFGAHRTSSEECIYPVGTLTQPIGAYSAGSYTLQVDLYYSNYPFGYTTMTIGTVPFSVTGGPSETVAAPVNDPVALMLLVLALVGIVALVLRRRRSCLLVFLLVGVPFGARAQDVPTIHVLVAGASGAPTPAQIVAYYITKPCSVGRRHAARTR